MASAADDPIDVPPAYAVVVERLRRAIHLGQYAAGDKFPPERAHAESLGVSRLTLRGAIRVLEGEGYVETRRGASGGVTVLGSRAPREELIARLRRGIEGLEAVQEFRLVNERLAAERAATRLGDDELARIGESVAALSEATGIGEFRRADSEFHLRIAAAADCALLRDAVEHGRAAMFMPLDALDYELMLSDTLRDHRRILAALERHDAAAAGRAMARHVQRTSKELHAILSPTDA